MATEIMANSFNDLKTALADDSKPIIGRLVKAFDCWAGIYVNVLSSSKHASEILDFGFHEFYKDGKNNHIQVTSEIAYALVAANYSPNIKNAEDHAHTMLWASQGIILTVKNREQYVKKCGL